jgi:Flp pilus assembly protein TadB
MNDSLLLLVTGLACSLVAWAFWHYLGNDAFGVLNSLLVTVLVVDNIRLRRQLRAGRGG